MEVLCNTSNWPEDEDIEDGDEEEGHYGDGQAVDQLQYCVHLLEVILPGADVYGWPRFFPWVNKHALSLWFSINVADDIQGIVYLHRCKNQ